MRIDRHVFGSRVGYTTLAYSEGLSESDCRKLEVFGFGQTSDRGYLESLASVPAYISRPLDQSHRAITRVFPGQPDDAGRNTLLLVSVILSNSEWIRTLRGDVLPLLNNPDLWQWDGQPRLASINTSIPGPHPLSLDSAEASEIVGLISEIERFYSSRRNVVISEPKYSLTTVRTVEMLIPDSAKPAFSCSARSLSANLSVNLNCVARGVGISSVGPSSQVYKPRTDGILSPYATELVRGRIIQGMIPDRAICSYRGFGTVAEKVVVAQSLGPSSEVFATGNTSQILKAKREPMSFTKKAVIGLVTFALIACSILGYAIYKKVSAENQRKQNADTADRLLAMTPQEFVRKAAVDRKKDLADADRVAKEIAEFDKDQKEPNTRAGELYSWHDRMSKIDDSLVGYENQIFEALRTLNNCQFSDEPRQPIIEIDRKITKALENAESIKSHSIRTDDVDMTLSTTIINEQISDLENKASSIQSAVNRYKTAVRDKQKQEMKARLELLIDDLQNEKREVVKAAISRSDEIIRTARIEFEADLKLQIEKAESAKVKATSDIEGSGLAKEIVNLMKKFLSEPDKSGEKELIGSIDQAIAKLKEVDSSYAEALRNIFDALKNSQTGKS